MKKYILLFLLISFLAYAQDDPSSKDSFTGSVSIDLLIGLYNDTNVSIINVTNDLETTNASTGFMGSLAFQYFFKNFLSFRLSAGALTVSVDSKVSTNIAAFNQVTVKNEVATVVPVLAGLNFYPLQLSDEKIIMPYIAASIGPYIGIYNRSEVSALSVKEETFVETVFGSRLGAGIDFRIGFFKLGINANYHFVSEFSKPIGSEKNYSGPEYSFLLGFIF
jgi:hypothetical protein